MPAEVKYEPASWRDLRDLVALERSCFGSDAWPWPEILAALTFPGTVTVKAHVGGQVVGFVFGDRRWGRGLGWIASIGVHPDFRGQGIGGRLLEICEQRMGLPRVRLVLRASNEAALGLYQKKGYGQVEVWAKYYSDGEDGLVMEKRLAKG